MIQEKTQSFKMGDKTIELSTGAVARQAHGSVMISCNGFIALCTVVEKQGGENNSFFPLTVNYVEKTYAAGKIPGSYFKREARPGEKEVLTSRMIDRALRPTFANGYKNEVQVVITVMSWDSDVAGDVLALIGASAALSLAGLPTSGPVAAAKVAIIDDKYLVNPSAAQLADSSLDLMVAGSDSAVLMVESEAVELTEKQMLDGVMFGFENMQPAIDAIKALTKEAGRTPVEWKAPAENAELAKLVADLVEADLTAAYQIPDKMERQDKIAILKEKAVSTLAGEGTDAHSAADVSKYFNKIGKAAVRKQVLDGKARIDGRDTKTVRPIHIKLGLGRTHGAACFTRGETQAMVVVTLGTERDAQRLDDLDGDRTEDFLLHYNFPPYSVGETGFMGSPKRREIGHGKLAKRALQPVIPSNEEFPYVLRIVSEITESNGSSSMATVCGASLAMMDAGVPTLAPVAGIAMGLIKEGEQFSVLTDILGDEDHLGDMDFKVAGTDQGITALQMDIKISGITKEIMEQALDQAKAGRLHILGEMAKAITAPRDDVSSFAPRYTTIKVKENKIRDIIGKGGATIRELTESTNTTIEVGDDGTVKIAAVNKEDAQRALKRIEELTAEAEIGAIYEGQVVKIMDFGAIVTFLAGSCQGLVHISQIKEEHVDNVTDHVNEGDEIKVKVIDIDRQGRVRLSMKDAVGEVTETKEKVAE